LAVILDGRGKIGKLPALGAQSRGGVIGAEFPVKVNSPFRGDVRIELRVHCNFPQPASGGIVGRLS
jgi:hypothetical protein